MSDLYEEEFKGFTIFVDISADRYNTSFSWSICRNENEYETGLSFSKEEAIAEAEAAVTRLMNKV